MKKFAGSFWTGIIPQLVLIVYAIRLVIVLSSTSIMMQKEHKLGLVLVAVTTIAFCIRYKLGIIFLGPTLIIGLIGVASLSPYLQLVSFGSGGTIEFNPLFLLLAAFHFLFSHPYYIGLVTPEYWREMFQNGYFGKRKRPLVEQK